MKVFVSLFLSVYVALLFSVSVCKKRIPGGLGVNTRGPESDGRSTSGSTGYVVTVLGKVDDPVNLGLTHAVFHLFYFILLPTYSLTAERKGT